jgi:hypothetical protein
MTTHNPAYSYVGWDEVFPGATPPDEGVAFYLRRLPKRWLVETLCKIGTTLYNSGSYFLNPNQQIAFIMSFKCDVPYAERIARFIAANPTRVLVHTNIVTAMMRQALLHGSNEEKIPGYAYDHLLRAIALFNSNFGRVRLVGSSRHEAFLPYELELMIQMKHNISFVMARYYRFVEWASAQNEPSDYYMPLERDFPRFFAGLNYEDYAAATMVVVTPFMSRLDLGDWRLQRGFVQLSELTANLLNATSVNAQVERLSIGIHEAMFRMSERADAYGLADIRPFIDRPLLDMGDGSYACAHMGFLTNEFGEGLYHRFFDGYKKNDGTGAALRFAQFFGRFLEEDTYALVREASERRTDVSVFPERKYMTKQGERKSPDVALFVGPVAVFIEVTRHRLPLDGGICDQQPHVIERTVRDVFVRKAGQLHRCIAEFKKGTLHYDGVESENVRRIFPVILTEQDFPQFIAWPALIRAAILAAGFLVGYEDVQFLSSEDIEVLRLTANGSMDLDGVLARKAALPQYVHRDMVTYLYDRENEKVRGSDEKMPGYPELWLRIKARLRDWGMKGFD